MLGNTDCPYGAKDCPKIQELKQIVTENQKELKELNSNVIRMNTTLKNASYIISAVITILGGILGVNLL